MTINDLHKGCWIYDVTRDKWYTPNTPINASRARLFIVQNAFRCNDGFKHISGVDDVVTMYQQLDTRIPVDSLPNGVFYTCFILSVDQYDSTDVYYVFTDVEQYRY